MKVLLNFRGKTAAAAVGGLPRDRLTQHLLEHTSQQTYAV